MDLDFSNAKPGVMNWIIVGLMAVTFILFMKWATARWPIPGLSEIFASI